MQRFLNHELSDSLGFTTVIGGVSMTIAEVFTELHVNEILQFLVTSGGVVFLFYKIKMIRLEIKIKKKNNEKGK